MSDPLRRPQTPQQPAAQARQAGHHVLASGLHPDHAEHLCELHNLWLGHGRPDVALALVLRGVVPDRHISLADAIQGLCALPGRDPRGASEG